MAARKKAFDKVLPTSKSESKENPKGRASVVQREVLSLYLKILTQGSLLFSKLEFSIKPDLRGLSFS